MKADIVVDVGNTRIKWGLCSADDIRQTVSLSPDDEREWASQLQTWYPNGHPRWVVSGVHRARRTNFVTWAERRGDQVTLVDSYRQLPLQIMVDEPERVGIDRLLNCVAALARRHGTHPCIVVDAGSAVTVDALDEQGVFRGGAIMPGLRLMAQALHDYTDALPFVVIENPVPPVPATSTETAIEAGLLCAVAGGIQVVFKRMTDNWRGIKAGNLPSGTQAAFPSLDLFLTGGDSEVLLRTLFTRRLPEWTWFRRWPEMTLEGLRLTAEALP
jgi:type III pantothenate kinase